ncbi:reverse transcriptase domain-containing protein [Tanacetum coccineum]
MEFESAQSNTTAKLPILKLGEYEMWVIRIKQYFQVQDYALWEVIENGNSWVFVPQTAQENGTSVTKMSVPMDIYIDENCGLLYKALIDQGVADALAARDVDRSMNGDDSHNSGTGVRRQAPLARECTYPDFIKCKPLYFKGTKGVVELTQWFERIETDVGHDIAYAMTWTNLKKMMTDKYCPRGEIKKLEVEMWNLKVKGTYVVGYNQRFQELTLMCARMFPEESDKIEKYISALPDMIHESVMAYKPKTMQDAIEFATKLMDKKISTLVERQAENKRKLDNINQAQQQPPKKQGVAIAYTAGSSKRKERYDQEGYTEGEVRDRVMLKVSPWKGVKCLSDESLVIPLEELHVDDKLHFMEEPVEVVDYKIKQLKRGCIPIIKVRWNSRRGPEFTWELEDQFQKNWLSPLAGYKDLFSLGLTSGIRAAKASSINTVNIVSTPVSTASPYDGLSFSDPTNPDQDDSEIPALKDIYKNPTDGIFTYLSYDDEGAVADFTNLETVVNDIRRDPSQRKRKKMLRTTCYALPEDHLANYNMTDAKENGGCHQTLD